MNDSPTKYEAAAASHDSLPTTTSNLWSIGVWCADATAQDIGRATTELLAAGLKSIRLFVHADTIIPENCVHIPVTVVGEHLPVPGVERLMVAELLMRSPTADAFLIISANELTPGSEHLCSQSGHRRVPRCRRAAAE